MTELFVADYLERFHNCLQVFQEKHKNFRTFKKKKKKEVPKSGSSRKCTGSQGQ